MPRTVRRPSGTYRLNCLGPGQLHGPDGRRIPLRTRKHLALLCILGQRPGRTVPRDRIIELLWSEDAERAARHSLSQSVSLVNKAVGVDLIGTEAGTRLVVGHDVLSTDVAEFEALAKEGRYDEARALWHGTLLDGVWLRRAPAFERWLTEERGRLERQMRRMATDLIERRRQDGDHVGMRAEAEALLALDPLDEAAMLACVQALTLGGERTLALRRYAEFETRLKAELDAEPGSALRGWAKRHRRGEVEAVRVPVVSRVHEVQALPAAQPLFGRVEEYRALWESWEKATTGQGSFWIIEGEPGIGKTALAAKLANQVHVSGASVCFVSCYRTEKSVPFAPISALIRQLARLPGFVAMNPTWIGELTRLVPELKDRFPNAPPPMGVDDSARFRLCDATVHATECVSDEQPLLIVVDDIHDADEATLATLHYLGRQVGAWPLQLIATTRPTSALDPAGAEFTYHSRQTAVAKSFVLSRLGDDFIARIASQELARNGLDVEAHINSVVPGSKGNPLLTIEACAALSGFDRPQKPRGILPDQFGATVLARLAALPRPAAQVAECLALAGRPLAEHELAAVLDLSPAILAESLMRLRDADFLAPASSRTSLTHDQYATTIATSLSVSQRRALHERLAGFLERAAPTDPTTRFLVASHLVAAAHPADARKHALAAASFAASLGAVREQAAALELAMNAHHEFDPETALQLAGCYLELGNVGGLEALHTRAMTTANCPSPIARSFDFLKVAVNLTLGTLTLPSGLDAVRSLVADKIGFPHRDQALGLLVRLSYRLGDARATRQVAKELRRRSGTSSSATTIEVAAYMASKFFNPRRALRYLHQALEIASARRDYALEHQCRAGLGAVLRQLGRFTESEAELMRGLALARRTMNRHMEASRLSDIACARMGSGDFEGAERMLLEAASIARSSSPAFTYHLSANLAEAAFLQGRYPDAVQRYTYAHAEASTYRAWSLELITAAGLTLCAQRQSDVRALNDWGSRVANLASGREHYLHDRWMVDAARAWYASANGGSAQSSLDLLSESIADLRRRDIDHCLLVRAERIRLEMQLLNRTPHSEIRSLTEACSDLNAGGALRVLRGFCGASAAKSL